MSDHEFDLDRFVDAQDRGGTYDAALAELRAGRKRTHWMWFVFPQLAGLGRSSTARFYALDGAAEAHAYLAHPVLGARLREATLAVRALRGRTADEVFGDVDAMKLRSCLTLFARVAPDETLFADTLAAFFPGPDPATDELLTG